MNKIAVRWILWCAGGSLALAGCAGGDSQHDVESIESAAHVVKQGEKKVQILKPPKAPVQRSQIWGPDPGSRPFRLVKDPDAADELNEIPIDEDETEIDENVAKDPSGYVGLAQTRTNFNFLYIANKNDWNVGSVSKIDSKTVKETARYFSVTCLSNTGGSKDNCTARDDYPSYTARKGGRVLL